MAKTVLIVEDNELNMKLFRDLLEAHGYQTSGTSNGYEALDLVRKMRPGPGADGYSTAAGLGARGDALDQGRSGAVRCHSASSRSRPSR